MHCTVLQSIQEANIKKMAQHVAPLQQAAPIKCSEPSNGLHQPSQPQAAKKVTARQSARMQKQQQKQAYT